MCGQGTWGSHSASVSFITMKHEQTFHFQFYHWKQNEDFKENWSEMEGQSPFCITKYERILFAGSGIFTSCKNVGSREKEFVFAGPRSYTPRWQEWAINSAVSFLLKAFSRDAPVLTLYKPRVTPLLEDGLTVEEYGVTEDKDYPGPPFDAVSGLSPRSRRRHRS